MAFGYSLEEAIDAVVELEVIGFQFSIDGDDLHYQGTLIEEQDGKQIPIPPKYIRHRLDLIKEYKSEIIDWLRCRKEADLVLSLERISGHVQERANIWQGWTDFCQQQTDYLWEHYTKVYRTLLLLEAENKHENPCVLQETNFPGV